MLMIPMELQLSVIIVQEVLMLARELMSTQTTPSLESAEKRGLQMWLLNLMRMSNSMSVAT